MNVTISTKEALDIHIMDGDKIVGSVRIWSDRKTPCISIARDGEHYPLTLAMASAALNDWYNELKHNEDEA
jgi:hypothetical protein